jgi:hypothetical protein
VQGRRLILAMLAVCAVSALVGAGTALVLVKKEGPEGAPGLQGPPGPRGAEGPQGYSGSEEAGENAEADVINLEGEVGDLESKVRDAESEAGEAIIDAAEAEEHVFDLEGRFTELADASQQQAATISEMCIAAEFTGCP